MDIRSAQNKIDALNKQAWEARVSDSNNAHLLSGEAVKLAREIGYTKGEAEALRTLGFTFIRLSKHDEARELLEQSFKLFEALDDLRGQSDIYEYYGIIERSVSNYKKSLEVLFKSLDLRTQTNYGEGIALANYHIGVTYRYVGNLEQALEYFLQSLSAAKEANSWIAESYSLNNIGSIYFELHDYTNALEYYNQSLNIRKELGDKWGEAGCLDNIGVIHFETGDYDKASEFCRNALSISNEVGDKKGEASALFHLAEINYANKNIEAAINEATQALRLREEIGDKKGQAEINIFLAELSAGDANKNDHLKQLQFLNNALALAEEIKALDLLYKIHHALYKTFKESDQSKEALSHLELSNAFEKEIHSNTINQKILKLEITHHVETSKKEAEIFRLRNIELVNLYEEIKKQNEEIESKKKKLEEMLEELKATQAQLVQSEKMASLGELTAGIAHEIQNPLNFVNNFSEVSNELLEEMREELENGNWQMANVIGDDVKKNLEKILYHGRRADSIVKSMLQHSRINTGQKELTNVNALVEEYFRLAYHGLRAKDKTFNATTQTDLDPSMQKTNIVFQEIGRVLLNLFNNAFYSVTEKKRLLSSTGKEYEPTVSVCTKEVGDKIAIFVKDNGTGVPKKVVDKIFQPFFTTKPTGQGTGLGLSLSYDIIKAHKGEIKIDTTEGEGSTFTILLPKS